MKIRITYIWLKNSSLILALRYNSSEYYWFGKITIHHQLFYASLTEKKSWALLLLFGWHPFLLGPLLYRHVSRSLINWDAKSNLFTRIVDRCFGPILYLHEPLWFSSNINIKRRQIYYSTSIVGNTKGDINQNEWEEENGKGRWVRQGKVQRCY